jgi:phenylacetate-coenzyme A ligase PaaK-like adenylate-forming protein
MPRSARRFAELLHIGFDDPHLIEKLRRFRPNGLTAYASVLTNLAVHAEELNLAPELRQITNISEGLGDTARGQVEAAFGVPVLDTYAMGECPFLSNGCPLGGAHVNTDWAILEVVDDQYRAVRAGETGAKVLVANLANLVQPIIRYEIGDMIEMATEPCACGNRLPKISRIRGRAAEALWIWDGSRKQRVLLNAFKCACEYLHDVREWQVRQTQPNRIKVCLELLPSANLHRENAARRLRERLGFFGVPRNTHVDVEYVDQLRPDSKTGKFKHLIGLKPAAVEAAGNRTYHHVA